MANTDSINLGLLFNKQYYKGFIWKKPNNQSDKDREKYTKNFFGVSNNILFKCKLGSILDLGGNHSVELITAYPGLVIGLGNGHGDGNVGEFKLGFTFDFTSGQPILEGSSLKGVIRSAFPGRYKSNSDEHTSRIDYISKILNEIGIENCTSADIKKIEDEIFESIGLNMTRKNNYNSDRFYGGVISKANNKEVFLDEDYLAVHHENVLADPKPLMFLKILPNVKFKFYFELVNSEVIPKLTALKKKELFEVILKEFGIGAKTNVGYGQFID